MKVVTKITLMVLCTTMLLVLTSCTINVSLQGLVSYYKKTKSENPNIFLTEVSDTISYCNPISYQAPLILVTNGVDLNQCLKDFDKSIVYIWAPNCKGKFCYSLNLLQRKLGEKGIELFIIAEYYDSQYMAKEYQIKRPISGIDVNYYKSNITSRYLSKFIFDLTKGEINHLDGRLIYFKNEEYENSFSSLEDVRIQLSE